MKEKANSVAAICVMIAICCTLIIAFSVNWLLGVGTVAVWAIVLAKAARELAKEE